MQGGKEQSFSSEEGRFNLPNKFNVIMDRRLESSKAAGIDADHLAWCQNPFHECPAGMNKCETIPLQSLHDESFTTKKTNTNLFLEGDTERHTFCRCQERIFLGDQFTSNISEMDS